MYTDRELGRAKPDHLDEKALREQGGVEESIEFGDVFKWAARRQQRGVLLLGDPGSGKTTGARQFCWRMLRGGEMRQALGLPRESLPVFLRLRSLTREHHDLRSFVFDSVAASTLPDDLARPGPDLLGRKGVVWVFDGLDEVVSEEARVKVCRWIRRAIEEHPDDYFLVTSRYQGYQGRVDLGPAFCQFQLKPLNSVQIADFVDHWYRTVFRVLLGPGADTETKAEADIRSFMDLLGQSEYRIGRLRELPANPLMLTILCLVHQQDRNLPRRRADLYAKCVRVLVEHWRREVRESQEVPGFDPGAAECVLSSVAWWLHEEEGRTSRTVAELGVVAGKGLVDLSSDSGLGRDGEEFIRRMRDESGVLAMHGGGQCGFLHLTFQEYLAGSHAAREGKAEALVSHVGSSWWREVILIALAVGSRTFAEEFFAGLLKTGALASQGPFVDQCLEEARYAVLEPFIEASRAESATAPRRVEILQRAGVEVERAAVEVAGAPLELHVDARAGIAFVTIPAGEFKMGSEKGEEREKPIHQVRITRPFLLGKYPVTNQEYQRFLEANPKRKPPEWEYACRAATTTEFYLGDSLSSEDANFNSNYPYGGAKKGPYLQRTSPVGSYEPNKFGLYDMHGNVWEWCQDWYAGDYYKRSPGVDPPGPDKGDDRVLRGGSWDNRGERCRSACRSYGRPSGRNDIVGFRVVLAPRLVQSGKGQERSGAGQIESEPRDEAETEPTGLAKRVRRSA